ncbi:MAG: glycosyltransferase family 4 protein, partial [Mycobacterium sp.]
MKIAITLGTDSERVGAEHSRSLPTLLTAAGHDVVVYLLGGAPLPGSRTASKHVVAIAGTDGELVDGLECAWRLDPPDVVHAHTWPIGLFAQLAAVRCGLPTVQTFHGTSPTGAQAGLAAQVLRMATWVTVDSNQELETVARLRHSRGRISVVTDGIDVDLVSPTPPAAAGTEPLIVGLPGTDDRDPGFGVVVHALARIAGTPHFLGLARPAQLEQLRVCERLAAALGLQDRVRLEVVDTAADVGRHLALADIATCTAVSATDHSSVLQAMAAGIPLVANDIGVHSDTVIDDVTGFLVPSGQPGPLAKALKSLIAQPFLRQSMG